MKTDRYSGYIFSADHFAEKSFQARERRLSDKITKLCFGNSYLIHNKKAQGLSGSRESLKVSRLLSFPFFTSIGWDHLFSFMEMILFPSICICLPVPPWIKIHLFSFINCCDWFSRKKWPMKMSPLPRMILVNFAIWSVGGCSEIYDKTRAAVILEKYVGQT